MRAFAAKPSLSVCRTVGERQFDIAKTLRQCDDPSDCLSRTRESDLGWRLQSGHTQGGPVMWPIRSQSAISTALITSIATPLLPYIVDA